MRRLSVVDLEAGGQCALGEGVWVVAEEGIVVAQQGVVDGAVWVCHQHILVLVYNLLKVDSRGFDQGDLIGREKLLVTHRQQISSFIPYPHLDWSDEYIL